MSQERGSKIQLISVHIAPASRLATLSFRLFAIPAAEVLVLLDVVRLEPDAEEVVPQLALVALHPVHLFPSWSLALGVDRRAIVLARRRRLLLLLLLRLLSLLLLRGDSLGLLPLLQLLRLPLLPRGHQLRLQCFQLRVLLVPPAWGGLEQAPDGVHLVQAHLQEVALHHQVLQLHDGLGGQAEHNLLRPCSARFPLVRQDDLLFSLALTGLTIPSLPLLPPGGHLAQRAGKFRSTKDRPCPVLPGHRPLGQALQGLPLWKPHSQLLQGDEEAEDGLKS